MLLGLLVKRFIIKIWTRLTLPASLFVCHSDWTRYLRLALIIFCVYILHSIQHAQVGEICLLHMLLYFSKTKVLFNGRYGKTFWKCFTICCLCTPLVMLWRDLKEFLTKEERCWLPRLFADIVRRIKGTRIGNGLPCFPYDWIYRRQFLCRLMKAQC